MIILRFLNSPLGILLLGSGIGSTFIRFVWEPFKLNSARRARREKFRNEAMYRFHRMKGLERVRRLSWLYGDSPSSAFVYGLNPEYRMWSLVGLVSEGWGRKIFTENLSLLEQFIDCDDSVSSDRLMEQVIKKLSN